MLAMRNSTLRAQSGTSLAWGPLLAFFAALALLLGAAAVAIGMVSLADSAFVQQADAAEADAPAARRCPECGWIESNREIPGGTDNRAIRIQEYTVRMVDGSSRVFT